MMLSIFQSISIPSTWLRWVRCRGWWQTKSKQRGCLMRRIRQTDRPVGTLIVSELVYCHLPNDWSPSSGVVKWILSVYSIISSSTRVSERAGMSLYYGSLNDLITSFCTNLRIYAVDLFSTFFYPIQNNWSWAKPSVCVDALWCVESCDIISLKPGSHSVCAYITSWMSTRWISADNSETFITELLPIFPFQIMHIYSIL